MARSKYGPPKCCRSVIGSATKRLIPLQYFLQLAAKSFGGEGLRQEIYASIECAMVQYGIPSVTGHIDDLEARNPPSSFLSQLASAETR